MGVNVIIIGAGIAGLTAAISLQQAGHRVKIFEKSKIATEAGAAVVCAPNGSIALQKLGIDLGDAGGVQLRFWETIHGHSLETINRQNLDPGDKGFPAPYFAVHRVDLFQTLLEKVTQLNTMDKGKVMLHLDSRVTRVDPMTGTVWLEDGSCEDADLLVAADGIHSTTRAGLFPAALEGQATTDMSAFRFLVPTEKLKDTPAAQSLCKAEAYGAKIFADTESNEKERHIMWYPCRSGSLQNFVGIYPTRMLDPNMSTSEHLLEEFAHFHPEVVGLPQYDIEPLRRTFTDPSSLGEQVSNWPLVAYQPLPTWRIGKVVLIGDAAHPMLPFGGQGANQAIEDGVALGALLQDVDDPSTLSDRIEGFIRLRYRRASRVQLLSTVRAGNEARVAGTLQEYMEPGIELPSSFIQRVLHDAKYNVLDHIHSYTT